MVETYPVMCLRVRRTYATQGLDAVLISRHQLRIVLAAKAAVS